jgi:CubicO group peptidase (beta-lactamase class C family)
MAGNTIKLDEKRLGMILHAFKGKSCAFYAERVENGETSFQGGAVEVLSDDSIGEIPIGTLFGYGSLQKPLFLNVALFRIIEKGLAKDATKRAIMKNSWDRRALKVLNELRKEDKLEPLLEPEERSPTILQMLTHLRAFTSSQQHLIGPDGNFIMCEDTFIQVFGRLTNAEKWDDMPDYYYSNWNFVVAELIIKHATGLSLSEALKELVLKPFELNNTVVDKEAFDLKKGTIAKPFIITPDATSQEVPIQHYLRDDIELAVGGGYSCIKDIAALLRFLMEAYTKEDKLLEKRFFESDDVIKGEDAGSQSFLSGLRVSLDSDAAASDSVERALSGSYYKLGTRHGQSVDVIMKGGTIRGYSCRYYLVPKGRLFVIVLTNSSGIVDPSLHIGQDILQELLGLENHKDIRLEAPKILANQSIVVQSCTAGLLTPLEFIDKEVAGLEAVFTDRMSLGRMDIKRSRTNMLEVEIHDSRSTKRYSTTRMRLLKIANNVLAVAPNPTEAAVDFHTVWRDFALKMEWDGDIVRSLQRIPASSVTDMNNIPEKGYKAKFERDFH